MIYASVSRGIKQNVKLKRKRKNLFIYLTKES